MYPPPLLAFALRHGLVPFEEILAEVRAARWDSAAIAWGLAPGLDDAQLEAQIAERQAKSDKLENKKPPTDG